MPVAFVTGASRGIGRAASIALAEAGFDVALLARTVEEGRGRNDGDFVDSPQRIEGSLEQTGARVEEAGGKALILGADLRDADALERTVDTLLETCARIDVFVNNALLHAGNNVRIDRLSRMLIEEDIRADIAKPLVLLTRIILIMKEQEIGRVINVTSPVGRIGHDPGAPPGEGGWGVLYSMCKAGQYRIAAHVAAELAAEGDSCFNIDPGFVKTAVVGSMPIDSTASGDVSVDVPAKVVAWFATSAAALEMSGQIIDAPSFGAENGLL